MIANRLLDILRSFVNLLRREFERAAVSNGSVLSAYHNVANGPDDRQRLLLFGRSHRNLHGSRAHFAWKFWTVRDRSVQYILPLRDAHAGRDWALALSAVAHDMEVKQLYRHLVSEDQHARMFVDIGANFGQHTHYFLAAGWEVWSFEPNPTCKEYHELICLLNGWTPSHWYEVALSDSPGQAVLSFPKGQEALGRIGPDELATASTQSIQVTKRTLSSLLESVEDAVVKIDVEGHEQHVLDGFPRGVERAHCVIFEALTESALQGLHEFFAAKRLEVFALAVGATTVVDGAIGNGLTNFVAVPNGSRLHEWLLSRL